MKCREIQIPGYLDGLTDQKERGHIGASSSLSRPARDTVAPTLSWAKGGAEQVVFSPDGRLVAVGHRDSDWSCGTVTFNPTATGYAGHVSAGQGRVISTHSSTHFSGSSHQRRQHQEITPPNTQRPGFGGGAQVPVYGRRSIMPPRQSRFDAQDFVGDGYANFDSRGGNPPPYEAAEKPSKGFWKR